MSKRVETRVHLDAMGGVTLADLEGLCTLARQQGAGDGAEVMLPSLFQARLAIAIPDRVTDTEVTQPVGEHPDLAPTTPRQWASLAHVPAEVERVSDKEGDHYWRTDDGGWLSDYSKPLTPMVPIADPDNWGLFSYAPFAEVVDQ